MLVRTKAINIYLYLCLLVRLLALRNIVKPTIGVFKTRFQYFRAGKRSLPLSIQVNVVYALTAVHNFININNLDNLGYFLKIQNEVINKKDIRPIKVESDIAIN